MGKKISDYTPIPVPLQDTDLFDVSQDDGGGGYDTYSFTGADLLVYAKAQCWRTGTETLVTGANAITFSTPLPSDDYTIIVDEIDGVGTDKKGIVKTANGFSITALSPGGDISYIALMNS